MTPTEPGKMTPMVGGEEYDMLAARRYHRSDRGRAKAGKRSYWRRFRSMARRWLKMQADDE